MTDPAAGLSHLRTRALARLVVHHRELTSTNDRAMALAKAGAPHGLTVIADRQTAGRGQRGRRWSSAAGAGLYVSFVLRTALPPARAAMTTLAAGVAVHTALQPLVNQALGLKWPNDVLVAERGDDYGKKLAGILFDVVADQDKIAHGVLGIGINLEPPSDPELAGLTTALTPLGASEQTTLSVLAHVANALETQLDHLERGRPEAITTAWTAQALGRGERVEVHFGDGNHLIGELDGLTADGALALTTPEGRRPVYHGRLTLPGAPAPR